jgi:hypothetical protein
MNTAGEAFPSKATISAGASLGSGKRAVDKAIDRLEAAQFLGVTKSKGRRPFRYQVAFPTSQTDATLTTQADATFSDPNVALTDAQRRTNGTSTSQTGATEVGIEIEREVGVDLNKPHRHKLIDDCTKCHERGPVTDTGFELLCDFCLSIVYPNWVTAA